MTFKPVYCGEQNQFNKPSYHKNAYRHKPFENYIQCLFTQSRLNHNFSAIPTYSHYRSHQDIFTLHKQHVFIPAQQLTRKSATVPYDVRSPNFLHRSTHNQTNKPTKNQPKKAEEEEADDEEKRRETENRRLQKKRKIKLNPT